jgi:hypothetical protein
MHLQMNEADLISRSVETEQPNHVAFINQVFRGFVGTQRNLVLGEIKFLCHPERESTFQNKKVTNLDDFHEDVLRRTVLDCYDKGKFRYIYIYIYIYICAHT